mmetsp:Transcript_4619/g.11304  ORF Transcript_4619/g.11304 Transcript_4619/m.11304 type:complete len:217 (+) Transcript_4619:905-1555(+)
MCSFTKFGSAVSFRMTAFASSDSNFSKCKLENSLESGLASTSASSSARPPRSGPPSTSPPGPEPDDDELLLNRGSIARSTCFSSRVPNFFFSSSASRLFSASASLIAALWVVQANDILLFSSRSFASSALDFTSSSLNASCSSTSLPLDAAFFSLVRSNSACCNWTRILSPAISSSKPCLCRLSSRSYFSATLFKSSSCWCVASSNCSRHFSHSSR